MDLLAIGLSITLAASVAGNIFLLAYRASKKKRALAVDAKQLLHDLTSGGAIVRVTVIDPEGLLVYRGVN